MHRIMPDEKVTELGWMSYACNANIFNEILEVEESAFYLSLARAKMSGLSRVSPKEEIHHCYYHLFKEALKHQLLVALLYVVKCPIYFSTESESSRRQFIPITAI